MSYSVNSGMDDRESPPQVCSLSSPGNKFGTVWLD